MVSIFPLLVPSLQAKLAQLGLLTNRAAVLAALPPVGPGRGTPWAIQPAPRLLQAVVLHAGSPSGGGPKMARLLLRAWFQRKTELRAAVHRALDEAGYPVLPLPPHPEPSPWNVRLAPEDVLHQDPMFFFCPAGQPVPNAPDASHEEVTLMAHLLGWSVLGPVLNETPPDFPGFGLVAKGLSMMQVLEEVLRRISKRIPADLAAVVLRGELPEEAALYWDGDWDQMRQVLADGRAIIQRALSVPEEPATAPLSLSEFRELLRQLETTTMGAFLLTRHREYALAYLARAAGLRHRQQPDFAPLGALHQQTAALRAAFEAQWPLDEEAQTASNFTTDTATQLLAQADPYRLLLRLVDHPEELAALDENTEDFQALEAAVPTGVLNALLLRKLVSPP